MPKLDLTDAEALLLVLIDQEEGRVAEKVAKLQEDLQAARVAAMNAVFASHGEKVPRQLQLERDPRGRPVRFFWKKDDETSEAKAAVKAKAEAGLKKAMEDAKAAMPEVKVVQDGAAA